jgi:hypothetical protein
MPEKPDLNAAERPQRVRRLLSEEDPATQLAWRAGVSRNRAPIVP